MAVHNYLLSAPREPQVDPTMGEPSNPIVSTLCNSLLCGTLSKPLAKFIMIKISEYGQEIPQSQTADKPMAPQGRATQICLFAPMIHRSIQVADDAVHKLDQLGFTIPLTS